ncbi:hypothetical protein BHE90_010861 [Fusarium euwallaceae]|uniref:Helicase ATP-binding domain-containing protein n=1 Tax=Fusarium euwallaceae TaxID=1147111 RepID=A0A430LG09_9HYPO|nr:hypothetical protein BHE90_010861 [Fusarium euwallaceae]
MKEGEQLQMEQPSLDIISRYVLNEQLEPEEGTLLKPWQTLPEIPEPDELMASDPPVVPPGTLDGEALDKSGYLESQYRMCRFEGTELLRRAVNEFRGRPTMTEGSDFFIYTQVHVQGYMFARAGPACRISFSTERSPTQVVWSQCTRLTSGTLVALSPSNDNFKTQCYVAVVAARYLIGGLEPNPDDGEDENTPPRIEIFWSNYQDAILDPSVELVMLEAKGGYFETVRHAMVGLQHAALFESKFDKYIIDGHARDPKAAYLQEAPGQTAHVPESAESFDLSQVEAFKRMTSRELAIVQGPPGTGKTFTSVAALESHVRTLQEIYGKKSFPPVLVAAQTNHALDQLLTRCESEFGAVICRLGGRTENEEIEKRTLFNIRKQSSLGRGHMDGEGSRKRILSRIDHTLSTCFPEYLISAEEFYEAKLITKEQFDSLDDDEWECAPMVNQNNGEVSSSSMVQWLDGFIEKDQTYVFRPPSGQKAPPPVDDDPDEADDQELDEKERLQGQFFSTQFYATGKVTVANSGEAAWFYRASKLLATHQDLYLIKPPQRGMVYRYLRKRLVDKVTEKFPTFLREYKAACDVIKIDNWNKSARIIRNERIEILGCTTTGLTKYLGLIAALKPRILMIEEAAETREANITSAMYPSLDQIVLVGDHQQLVPHIDVRELGQEPYNMHVSLFQRLVQLELPFSKLRVQRRMIPAIREVVNTFYADLEDHSSVTDPSRRPPIPGMGGRNLFWFHHHWPESQNPDDFSYSNPREAEMMVRFVRYLVVNDTRPSAITLLTYYKGQVNLLLEKLRRDQVLSNYNPTKEWSVRTVDGFQGEENDIILLSLVRSSKPGFVDNENRAVVATSRARRGMYIFGDALNLLQKTRTSRATWAKVYDVFVDNECIDVSLPVTCKKHGRVTEIGDVDTWDTIPGCGCNQRCDEKCPNGHPCQTTCHPSDQARLKCRHACEKVLSCGHGCGSFCGDPCECPHRCTKPPSVQLPLRGKPVPQGRGGRPGNGNGTSRGGKNLGNRGGRGGRGGRASRGGHTQTAFPRRDVPVAPVPVPPVPVPPVHQEPTSEELMEMGYYSHMSQPQPSEPRPLDNPQAPFQSGAITLTEDSLSEKWSPKKVQRRDAMLQEGTRRQGPSNSRPVEVRVSFRQTTMAANCTRVCGRPSHTKYTIPAPSPKRGAEVANSEVSVGAAKQQSRKHMVLDAAAGFTGMADYAGSSSAESQSGQGDGDDGDDGDDGEDDLISFE